MHPAAHPFLYQLVGTWGQFLFPSPWRAFRLWSDLRRHNESREPVLEGLETTQWWFRRGALEHEASRPALPFAQLLQHPLNEALGIVFHRHTVLRNNSKW